MNVRHKGFTLIEILVAVVILAFGLLGIAGLQLSGVRATQSSAQRSTAVAVLNEVAEKIHANQPGAKLGLYKNYTTVGVACPGTPPTICAKENGASAPTGCLPNQLALYDLYALTCGVPNGSGNRAGGINSTGADVVPILPGGILTIDCIDATGTSLGSGACAPGRRYRVTVTWNDRGDLYQPTGTSGTSYTTTLTYQPLSVQMVVQP